MRTAGLLIAIALFSICVCLPVGMAYAVELININTADLATLDTLPHIGEVTAQKIIDYREANGPYQTIEDIRKASSYISQTYYADIAPLITVGDASTTHTAPSNETDATASSTTSSTVSANTTDTSTSVSLPLNISVSAGQDVTALIQVPFVFTALVKTKSGVIDSSARVHWSFGDGSATEGRIVEKTYRYAGTYLAVVTATNSLMTARDEIVVTVKPAEARIAAISNEGIILANDADEYLDLSNWRLLADFGSFRIPEGTTLLPKSTALFPYSVTNLPTSFTASLAYPNGSIATQYVPPVQAIMQPATTSARSIQVQKVEPSVTSAAGSIISTKTNIQKNDETVDAPAATTKLAAAGAALSSSVSPELETDANTRLSGIFHSPWTLGLLGIILVAGGAFIFI